MAELTDSDRSFLSQPWRWVEITTPAIKSRHDNARELEIGSPLATAAKATTLIAAIQSVVAADNRLMRVVVDGITPHDFRSRPPTYTLLMDRWGYEAGRVMLAEQIERDWARRRTTLYLYG